MVKNIIFDMGGVLISLDKKNCIKEFEGLLMFEGFEKYIDSYHQKGFFARFENGDISSDEFRDEIRRKSKLPMIGDRQIDFAVQSFLGDIKLSTVDYLLSLKRKYTLFLLSNTNEIAFPKCREKFLSCKGIPMERVFDKLYLSYEMKLSKPDPKIFRSMISDSGILPEECLFVDDASENIAVASGLGFRTLLFDPAFNIKELVENYLKKNG